MTQSLVFYSNDDAESSVSLTRRVAQVIGANTPRMGYVASSPDPGRVFFERKRAHYENLGVDLCAYLDSDTCDLDAALSSLMDCDAIHLSGGNTFSFLGWLRERGALPALQEYGRTGGPLVGVSAGAILLTSSVSCAELCGDVQPPGFLDMKAMGLVDFEFWPHYTFGAENGHGIGAFLRYAPLVYACPDGAGLVAGGGKVEMFGDVRVFRYGVVAPNPAMRSDRDPTAAGEGPKC
ncbi:MAG: type 1 glutamine amidotransferase-like domain-containing protein [bacterium]|nr:type 1 glutamine amidotransferase-like domain-containing protein [bacterium]